MSLLAGAGVSPGSEQLSGVLLLDGTARASKVDWNDASSWRPAQGQLWVHIDPTDPDPMRWLRERSGLPPWVIDELTQDNHEPHLDELEHGAILLGLRGLAPDLDRGSAARTQLHIWADEARMISVCDRPLPGVQRARDLYARERGPRDLKALMIMMAAGLAASLRVAATKLEAAVADIEYVSESGAVDTSAQLGELRRDVATARRTLAPFKVLTERILTLRHSWLLRDALEKWQRIADVLRDTDALLQSLHERLISVHDFVGERLSRRMNDVLYRLTIFSTILLPITAITGLFGMNVGVHGASYRFMDGSFAFVLVSILLCALGWLEYRFMRRRCLLLPSLDDPAPRSATERKR